MAILVPSYTSSASPLPSLSPQTSSDSTLNASSGCTNVSWAFSCESRRRSVPLVSVSCPPLAHPFVRLQKAVNGVVWYIIGVIFVLSVYPLDIATVSILMYVIYLTILQQHAFNSSLYSLSWADTAASTIGRLWGAYTPPLPRSLPLIPYLPFFRLPLAPRKSLAGFLAGSITGAAIALGFWGFFYPVRDAQLLIQLPSTNALAAVYDVLPEAAAMAVKHGVRWMQSLTVPVGKWAGLTLLGVVSGLISGTAEALGTFRRRFRPYIIVLICTLSI